MVSWSDIGVVLSSHRHGEKYRIINIFTRDHGKTHAMVSCSKVNTFSIFSNVDVDYSAKDVGALGFWKLKSENQNWIFSMNSPRHLLVYQGICFLLNKLLPSGVPHRQLFGFTEYITRNLLTFSEEDVLLLYVYFEFSMLGDIGLSLEDLDSQTVPKLHDLSALPSILNSAPIRTNAKRLLLLIGKVIDKNLLSIDNYYRSAIFRLI